MRLLLLRAQDYVLVDLALAEVLEIGVDLGLQVVEPARLEFVGLHLLLINDLFDCHQGQLGGLAESRGDLGRLEELGRLHRGVLHQAIAFEEFH